MSYKIKKFIFLIFWIKTIFIIQAKADIIKANCLIDEYYLQEQKVDRSEQEVLAGRVIKLEIDTSKKLVFDKSDVKRIIILTGITEEGVKYEGSSGITYQNELKVMDQENKSEPKKIHYIIVISITILFLVFLRLRALERENMIKDKVEETIIN